MPVNMVSLRDYTLRTKTGHTIFFPAGKPTQVPDEVVAEAMAVNIVPSEHIDLEQAPLKFRQVGTQTITGSLRDSLIFGAIEELVRENDPSNFNAGGQPKVSAVAEATGVKLGGGELSKYWERYREIKATNADLPVHPRTENVLELQGLASRSQLVEYAKDMGFDAKLIDKKSIKEAKEILMHLTINYHESASAPERPANAPNTSTLVEQDD